MYSIAAAVVFVISQTREWNLESWPKPDEQVELETSRLHSWVCDGGVTYWYTGMTQLQIKFKGRRILNVFKWLSLWLICIFSCTYFLTSQMSHLNKKGHFDYLHDTDLHKSDLNLSNMCPAHQNHTDQGSTSAREEFVFWGKFVFWMVNTNFNSRPELKDKKNSFDFDDFPLAKELNNSGM